MGRYLLVIGDKCPACPIVEKVLKEMGIEFEVKNADHDPDYYKFIMLHGLHYDFGIPVPQLFYIDDDGTVTYLYCPSGETEELIKKIVSDRIEKLKKQHIVGKNFLFEDLEEIEIYDTKAEKLRKARDEWLKRAERFGIVAKTIINGNTYLVDMLRLGRLIENKFNCLCFKGLKCPCPRFLKSGFCSCGVFFKFEVKEEVDSELEELLE